MITAAMIDEDLHFARLQSTRGALIMKLNKTLLTLIAAVLLPAAAYASTDDTSADSLSSSCSSTITMETAIPKNKVSLEEAIINALANNTDDPVLASYYLDFYHWPDSVRSMQFSNAPDPYLDAVTLALFGPTEVKSRYVC